jgi:hypothetical protein
MNVEILYLEFGSERVRESESQRLRDRGTVGLCNQ